MAKSCQLTHTKCCNYSNESGRQHHQCHYYYHWPPPMMSPASRRCGPFECPAGVDVLQPNYDRTSSALSSSSAPVWISSVSPSAPPQHMRCGLACLDYVYDGDPPVNGRHPPQSNALPAVHYYYSLCSWLGQSYWHSLQVNNVDNSGQ